MDCFISRDAARINQSFVGNMEFNIKTNFNFYNSTFILIFLLTPNLLDATI